MLTLQVMSMGRVSPFITFVMSAAVLEYIYTHVL